LNNKKKELEKRIFILFFVITFLIVFILIIIEWELAKFGINQYEDMNINLTLSELKTARSEMGIGKQNLLQNLEADEVVARALQKGDAHLLHDHIIQTYHSEDIDKLIICNKQHEYIFGEQWELLDKYLSQIYQDISKENSGIFVGNFGNKLFDITYNPIFSSNETKALIGVLIIAENFDMNSLKLRSDLEVSLVSYNNNIFENDMPDDLIAFVSDINNLIESMTEKRIEQTIKKLNINYAAGIRIFYDLMNEPTGIFVISYNRYVNKFVQQSILIFILILLAVTLIMISLLGNWFSKTILIPVRNISDKMQHIANNPSSLKQIEEQYSGVLGDMAVSFNTMNIALSKYGQSLSEYKELTDNLDTGVFWLNNKFDVILFNPSFIKILELDKDVPLHNNLCILMGLEKEFFTKLYEAPLTFSNLEINLQGNLKYVALNIRAVDQEDRIKFFGSIIDVTKEVIETEARKSLELELIKSNKFADIGKRIEGIVHNINSPLNTVLGYAQLLKRDLKDNNDIDRIIEAGKNIAQTVKGLLTKTKQSNISIDRPVDINEIISQELDFCQHNLFFKHYVKLTTDFKDNIPTVTASYGDLSLCIANVINNAIQAMKDSEQKELTVRTYNKNKMIYIEIADTGLGIFKHDLSKIFEPYFSTKSERMGTGFGLGLAITKSIIEKYDGKIEVDSTQNVGTTFKLILHQTKGQLYV